MNQTQLVTANHGTRVGLYGHPLAAGLGQDHTSRFIAARVEKTGFIHRAFQFE